LITEFMNILVIKQTSLGDVLHSTAQVKAIREYLPDCRLTLLTSTTAYDIYRYNPHINKIILFDRYRVKRDWWRHPVWVVGHIAETFREVRRESYDLALDLQGRWKSVIFLWGARAGQRFIKGRWWFARSFHHPELHALEEMNGVLELAGIECANYRTEFFTSTREAKTIDEKLSHLKINTGRWILCSPLSRWPTKDWPLLNYVELARRLPADVGIVFTGVAEDQGPIHTALRDLPPNHAVSLVGELSVAEFAELVSRAAAVVTGDSFPMHVAVAQSRPTIALFGPTDEGRVGPLGDSIATLRAENQNCGRCYRQKWCPRACIRSIRVEQVTQALQQVGIATIA
jgi:ADP-heptose:LPS heptosyltransferase